MLNIYNVLFFITLVSGTLVSISSNSWLGMWVGLEVNLLSIIPLISNSNNIFSSEASLNYFITQALASSLIIFSVIIMSIDVGIPFNITEESPFLLLLNSSLLINIGAAPFHFWLPEVIEGLNWNNSIIILTWQNIAPIAILIYTSTTTHLIIISVLFCIAVSGLMGLNQTSLRNIIAYSSINHLGWILASTLLIETIWIHYFSIYTIITLNIILMLKNFHTYQVVQIQSIMANSPTVNLIYSLNFLSLGGLPPFLGFLPNWIVAQNLAEEYLIALVSTIVVITILTIYFYMRIILSFPIIASMGIINLTKLNIRQIFYLISSNILTLLSLVACTLIFNWL